MNENSKTAFITGGNGFVGQHLAQQLCAEGHSVSCLLREGSDPGILSNLPVTLVPGELTKPDDVQNALATGFDWVFHVAANTSMHRKDAELQARVNVDGTNNIIRGCQTNAVGRLIYTSTIAVYGFHQGIINEQTEQNPNGDWIGYIRTKRAAEAAVRAAIANGLDGVILNPAHVMGPLDKHNWVRMYQMIAKEQLPAIPPGRGAFADVRSVAAAHIKAAQVAESGDDFLLGGDKATFEELVRRIAQTAGVSAPKLVMPAVFLRGMAKIEQIASHLGHTPRMSPEEAAMVSKNTICDSSKAIEHLDYQITPLPQLIQDTLAWMKQANLL